MGDATKIEWCDATFNPVIGCQEVSAACDFCYAREMNARWGWVKGWGPHGERKRTSPSNWRKPYVWAKAARASGKRPRVFCASLADVFDNRWPKGTREDLFKVIRETPELDWLLLTKRPENMRKMLPADWGIGWHNVWLGTTAEDQDHFNRRWRILHGIPAVVRFISYEPALGALDISRWFLTADSDVNVMRLHPDWFICGGESGRTPRMMDPEWARALRDQCAELGVAFFLKQMTDKQPIPADLLVRQFPVSRQQKAAA